MFLSRLFTPRSKRRLVYTLSGGAAYGYAHIGVIRFLEEQGLYPHAVVGTSMGAIVGGLYASGRSAKEIEAIAYRIRSTEIMKLFFPSFPRGGIIDSDGVRNFLHRYLGDRRIEDLPVDYRSIAMDIETGEQVIFDSGPLLDAVISSMSIPAVFNPYRFRGRSLVDGGVVNNLPWDLGRELGDIQIVVNVAPHKRERVKKRVFTSSIVPESAGPMEEQAGAPEGRRTGSRGAPEEQRTGRQPVQWQPGQRSKLRRFVDTIKDRDEFYPKRLLETLSKRSEARQETLSLPEVVTNVMAIINEELLLPPKSIRGTNLYIHPDLMEFSLNDFNRAEEIISVGYHTAVESASFRAAVSRIAGRTAPPSPVPGEPSR